VFRGSVRIVHINMAILTGQQLGSTSTAMQGTAAKDAHSSFDEGVKQQPRRQQVSQGSKLVIKFCACLVWPAICLLPLVLTLGGDICGYGALFPREWYDEAPVHVEHGPYRMADPRTVKPLGLTLGLLVVAVGQAFTFLYHALRRSAWLGETQKIQPAARPYDFREGLATHLSQPEGFALIGSYVIGTWMLGWMPASYYSFSGGINWPHVASQLLLQDLVQAIMHWGEHKISAWVYKKSHKPHHRFTDPRLFDAFDGSLTDTSLMIVIPLILVARMVPANVWSYMTFAALYSNWLVLIHSEYVHPWDCVFRKLGFGTAADHHVHHRLFVFNYGHLFMYWDKIFGTYRDPAEFADKYFNKDV